MTLWHVSVLGIVLLAYSVIASWLLLRELRQQQVRHAIQDIETVEGLLYFSSGELRFREDYHNHPESKLVLKRLLEVRSADTGRALYRNTLLGERSLGGALLPGEGVGGYSERTVELDDGDRVQMVSRRHVIDGYPVLIRLGYREVSWFGEFRPQFFALIVPIPLVIVLAGIGGYVLASQALRPIEEMTRRASEITGERLNARLPVSPTDGELADLARVFNRMLSRLENSFDQLRRFTSDASHELRTPLAAIRSVGEVGLQKHLTSEDYRDAIGSMLEEAGRLTRLVDALLTISRADAGQIQLHPTGFRAIDLGRECEALFEVLLEDKSLALTVEGDENLWVCGDFLLLRQALLNVVDNAIKYSVAGGSIAIRVRAEGESWVVVEVQDSGPGIAAEHVDRIFDRFYRVESGRSREVGGAGLGLSIARWTVEAHGGRISAKSGPQGSVFLISVPAIAADEPGPIPQGGPEAVRSRLTV